VALAGKHSIRWHLPAAGGAVGSMAHFGDDATGSVGGQGGAAPLTSTYGVTWFIP
jgi:hypothetical protein